MFSLAHWHLRRDCKQATARKPMHKQVDSSWYCLDSADGKLVALLSYFWLGIRYALCISTKILAEEEWLRLKRYRYEIMGSRIRCRKEGRRISVPFLHPSMTCVWRTVRRLVNEFSTGRLQPARWGHCAFEIFEVAVLNKWLPQHKQE